MDTLARQVCLNACGDAFLQREDAEHILRILRKYFQLDSLDHINRQVAKFSRYERTDQTTERYLLELEVLRRRAEARDAIGGPFPDAYVPILRMQNAALSRNEKLLLLASVHWSLDFPIAATQMRRLFKTSGSPARQDDLAATDFDMKSEEEAAYRKAPKAGTDPPRRPRSTKGGAN